MIRGDEHAVYGDKAYASQDLRDRLADAGIADGLMYQAARNKPLKPWQSWFNKAVAAIRAAVERRFGIMKRGYGFAASPIGLVRNAYHLHLLCTAIGTSSVHWRLPDDTQSLPEQVENGKYAHGLAKSANAAGAASSKPLTRGGTPARSVSQRLPYFFPPSSPHTPTIL